MSDSILMEYDYTRYLESCLDEQLELEQTVHELLIPEEYFSRKARLDAFVEATTDKSKSLWSRFKAWVKQTWAKFIERINKTFLDMGGYLKRYEKTILQKKVKEGYQVDIANHQVGIQNIFKTKIDPLDAGQVKSIADKIKADLTGDSATLTADNANEYIAKVNFAAMTSIENVIKQAGANIDGGTDHIKSALNEYFLGGPVRTINTNDASLNMTDMYEWCRDAEKIKNNIDKDQQNYSNNLSTIENTFDVELKKLVAEQQAANNGTGSNNETSGQAAQSSTEVQNANNDAAQATQAAGGTGANPTTPSNAAQPTGQQQPTGGNK